MKQIFKETVGNCSIVIAEAGGIYQGALWQDGKQRSSIEGEDLAKLKTALLNEAGKLHPDYYGIKGAKDRFLSFFPDGFRDENYRIGERDYKDRARTALVNAAPIERAVGADGVLAADCRKGVMTNLLSQFEAARLNELLGSSQGAEFLRAAADFTVRPDQGSLNRMKKAISPHGAVSWPLVTYLPFLWSPAEHMFLKPAATLDFATRVGDKFSRTYEADLRIEVYHDLLELADDTFRSISDLAPQDRIDVQSFIWVVGSYK